MREMNERNEAGNSRFAKYKITPVLDSRDNPIPNLVTRNGAYYVRATFRGKTILRKCPYQRKDQAVSWKNTFVKKQQQGGDQVLESSRFRTAFTTVGKLLELYGTAAAHQYALDGKPKPATARKNMLQLANIIRQVEGVKSVDKLSLEVITRELAGNYVKAVVLAAGDNELLKERARITAASTLRQAKSLFCKWARTYYADAALQLPPSVSEFMETGKAVKPKQYELPPLELRNDTFEAAAALRESNPTLHAAFVLCYDLGMRASEAINARWEWIETQQGQRVMHICKREYWQGAKNQRNHYVPMSDEAYQALQAVCAADDPRAHILPANTPTERYDIIARQLSAWMRELGWVRPTFMKAAHELRKLAGSKWYTEAGVEWASEWLGDTVLTTAHFYSALTKFRAPVTMR